MMKTDDYNDQSVTEEKLKDGAITTRKIADGSVTKDKLAPSIRQEINDSVTASNEATEKAKEATAKADQATENAKQATVAATAAKEAADTATQAATTATTASVQATEQAKAATAKAEEATAKANEAAQKADDSREQTEQTLGTMQEVIDKTAIKDEEGTLVETPFRYIQNEEFIFAKVDAEDKLLFGIQWDGTPEFGKTSAVEDRLQSQVTLLAERVATIMGDEDTTNVIDTMNELKKFFAEIENTETLTSILANLDNVAKNLDKTTIKDEEGNVQDTPFRVIENEEFIMAVVDSEDRLLFGIYRATGKPYYHQNDMYHISQSEEFLWVILDAANHPLLGIQQDGTCWAAKAQWLDDIKAIKEALSSIDATLKTFQPKEDGKGLINLDVADSFFYISNDEYIIAVVDAENRILAGIKYDGEPYFPNHEMYSVITNEEWLYAIIDAEDKILGGFRADDGHMIVGGIDISTFIANAIIDIQDIKGRTAHLSTIVNDEYLSVETDAEGKVIGYIAPDGSHYLYKVKSETIPEEFSHIEDPEGRTEITTDAAGKVLGYRDMEGTRHEHKISAEDLKISKKAVNSIIGDFTTAGIKLNPSDWSNEKYIHIPIPECAYINLLTSKMPTAKSALGISGVTCNIPCDVEFNDMQGNYFRKPILLSAQGDSTMAFNKKNLALDFFATTEDRDNDGDTFSMKFGDWVAQDSFHLKAYYQDAHRGVSAVSYMICEEMAKSRNTDNDRPYKYLFATKYEDLSLGTTPVTKLSENFGKGAKCFPQGFPVIVYQNGVFYGVYSWQLKKHRDNYFMDKKDAKNVHLDGILSKEFWKGNINWSEFEVRNPKSIYYQEQQTINGKKTLKYNGDFCYEIMGKDSAYYDAENKDMKKCAEVKNTIIRLSQALGVLQEAVNAGKSEVEVRKVIEEYFMPSFLIDYILEINVTGNTDATNKNWQWTTWDSLLWTANAYDHDMLFGAQMLGNFFGNSGSSTSLIGDGLETPLGWIVKYYKEELKERYTELRKLGIFNTQHICDLIKSWEARIGYENYDKEYEKWNESPCNRPSCIDYEHWALSSGMVSTWVATTTYNSGEYVRVDTKTYKSLTNSNVGNMPGESSEHWEDATFNEAKTYSENDICGYGKYQTYLFRCVKSGINIPPLTKFYNSYPYELGTFDSVYRVYYWLKKRIENLDKYFEFKF